jgi:hypothetical protein
MREMHPALWLFCSNPGQETKAAFAWQLLGTDQPCAAAKAMIRHDALSIATWRKKNPGEPLWSSGVYVYELHVDDSLGNL